MRLSADFSKETLKARRDWQEIFTHEKQGPTAKIALPSKAFIQNQRADKELPRQEKQLKEFIITKPLYEMLKKKKIFLI